MNDQIPSINTTHTRVGRNRYVSDIDETGLDAIDAAADEDAPSSVWDEVWKHLHRRPTFWITTLIIVPAALLAPFPPLFTTTGPKFYELSLSLAGPSAGHSFDFGKQGYDIYARVVYGARAPVSVGTLTVPAVMLIGGAIGTLAGYFGD